MPEQNAEETSSPPQSSTTFRIEPGHSLPGLDDGWAVYRATDEGDGLGENEELLAVVATEALANAVIELLRDDAQEPSIVRHTSGT